MDNLGCAILIMLTVLGLTAFLLTLYRRHRFKHHNVPIRDPRKGHRFYMSDMFTSTIYCNVDECRLVHGARCDTCGIYVDDHNMEEANKKIPCKLVSTKDSIMHHHWVRGNLLPYSDCYICGEELEYHDSLTGLIHLRCCWCRKTAHDNCAKKSTTCDLGQYKEMIVPPHCIEVKWVGVKGMRQRHMVVKNVCHPQIDGWSPLLVIANRKSGSNEGEVLLQQFRGVLNSAQVIDIQDISPENALAWCNLLPDVTFRLLICGGDGTIGWVLSAIERLNLQTPPRICILPLGTGNDLSRVLGWGEGYSGVMEVMQIINRIKNARPVELDRWTVNIQHEKKFGLARPSKLHVMNNYLSIGVDALVTLNFHRQRESWPSLFAHRIINKFCYFTYGTKDVLERECKDLHKKLKVELDGREVLLPGLEGVVVLNIASWGGGCRPWGVAAPEEGLREPSYDDGVMEVMGLFSSFHIAQLQVGLASPLRLGQAKTVTLTLHGGNAPMQVDGEPWEQHPAKVTITHRGKAAMMALD